MIGFEIPRFEPRPEYWRNFLYQIRSQTGDEFITRISVQQELNKYGARYHSHSFLESLDTCTNDFVEFEDEKQLLLFILRYS